jgi:hypothetical protein
MRPRMIATGAAGLVLLLGGAAVYTVANASGAGDGAFNDQAKQGKLECLAHQKARPGENYTAGASADTGKVLRMLRYYTVNGAKPFCDGQGPTAADQAWAELYVELGADPAKVRAVTGAG